jgi:hypothetical protein
MMQFQRVWFGETSHFYTSGIKWTSATSSEQQATVSQEVLNKKYSSLARVASRITILLQTKDRPENYFF